MTMPRICPWHLGLLCLLAVTATVTAEPSIRALGVRGLQIGGKTTLVVDGSELGSAPRLLCSFPIEQTLAPGARDNQATFAVTVPATVPPGYYHLRAVTETGVSPPSVICLDRLPQRPVGMATETLPVALHGTVNGSGTVEAKFTGKAGQKVLVEIEAQRLGSKLRSVIHLLDPKRQQLAWAWSSPSLWGDARLEANLPQDGVYTVSVHDAEYASPAPGFFRLKVGQWSFIDQVFPPVVGKEQKAVELIGSGAPVRIDLPANRPTTTLALDWPKDGVWSGPRPFVQFSSRPEFIEQPSSAKVQEIPAGSVGVSGRLLTPGEEDRYRIPVTAGSRLRFEVFSERLGSPLDVALVVRNEMGAVLARSEDSPGSLDPVLEFAVPDKMTHLVAGIVDAQNRGGPRGIYRLTVDPVQARSGLKDFRLITPTSGVALSAGGRRVLPVLVERQGYRGRITLTANNLPAGVKLEDTMIPADSDGVLVTLQTTQPGLNPTITSWKGTSEEGLERAVVLGGDPLERIQPWLASEIALTSAKGLEFNIDWRNLAQDAGLVPAGKLALPVKLSKPENTPVRLSLLTSQLPPLVNNQPDLNQTIRRERPIELPAKTTDGEVPVLVPPQLPSAAYDVCVQAELLTADKSRVLAMAFTPVRRLPVRLPVALQLEGPARIETTLAAGKGAALEIKGKVERKEGFSGDATVTLTGLPAGIQVAPVTVKAGTTAFVVKVNLPPTLAAGEFADLRLSAAAAPDAKQPNVRVKSRDVELTLVIKKPSK